MPELGFDPVVKLEDIRLSRDIALETEMPMADTTGQFNDAAARKIHCNNSVSMPGMNIDEGTADPARRARNDDDASRLLHQNFSAMNLFDLSPSMWGGKVMRR
ncbi:hypothetical protein GCM10007880_65180 [Mesorhizobium amorphae]|nr:hypothetical protein GCM10007880_65180 [Mesorhizobium amorphae]